jgi:DNA-directed RNA polymerase subunit M/transcription elongation factor TFIIS
MQVHHKCPKCGSDELDTKVMNRTDVELVEEVMCMKCQHLWTNYYALTLIDVEEKDA